MDKEETRESEPVKGLFQACGDAGGAWKYNLYKRCDEVTLDQSEAVSNFVLKKLCGHQAFCKRPGIREILIVRVTLVCEGESKES